MRVLGITPQPVSVVGAAELVSMIVTVEGRYFGIRDFLRILRSYAEIEPDQQVSATGRLFAIDQIQFTGAATPTSSLIQATLAVNAFAFSQAVAPPVAGEAGGSESAATETGAEATNG